MDQPPKWKDFFHCCRLRPAPQELCYVVAIKFLLVTEYHAEKNHFSSSAKYKTEHILFFPWVTGPREFPKRP